MPIRKLAILLAGGLLSVGVACATEIPAELWTPSQRAAKVVDIAPVRREALREAAMTIGAQRGFEARAKEIIKNLEARASGLGQTYRFTALVDKNGVLPPVITEGKDSMVVGQETMRVADSIYRIEAPARFVSVAPTWRDYLLMGLVVKRDSFVGLIVPKDDAELALWRAAIKESWLDGIRQADRVFELNLARLERDFAGMVRYSLLLSKGMVTAPVVAVTSTAAEGNRDELRVGDTRYRVTDRPGLVVDHEKWSPVMSGKAN